MHTILYPISTLLVLGAQLIAQNHQQAADLSAIAPPRIPIHTASADRGLAYGTWAAGDNYKVSFHDGMTFVPLLGRDYPRNQPWSWSTTSVSVGGDKLLAGGERAKHAHQEFRYEYRYLAFTEAYDVGNSGIEQTFVFEQLPRTGDLVIQGRIDSALVTNDVPAAHQELAFVDEHGKAILSYGAAQAYDATGRRLPLTTRHEHGEIEIVVPEAWLRDVTLPLVVDPIIATSAVITNGTSPVEIDIAREDDSPAYNLIIASAVGASGADFDLRVWMMHDDYSYVTPIYTDITTAWSTDEVSCAYVGGADRWAIVFVRHFINSTQQKALRCHVHPRWTPSLSTSYISQTAPAQHNDWHPDVGGSASGASGNEALVVFQREDNQASNGSFANTGLSEVRGAILDLGNGGGTFGGSFPIQGSFLVDCEHPSVNQVGDGGLDFSWVCALQVYNNWNGGVWDVYAHRIGNDGTKASGIFQSDLGAGTNFHQLRPIVEGQHGRYAVLFATTDYVSTPNKTGTTNGTETRIERFDWQHGAAAPDATTDRPPTVLMTSSTRNLNATGLAYDTFGRSHWVACQHGSWLNAPTYHRVGYQGLVTETGTVPNARGVNMMPCTFDDDLLQVKIACNLSLFGGLYATTLAYPTETVWTTSGTGCTPSGYIAWGGYQQIGSEFSRPAYAYATPTSLHAMVVSTAASNLPLPLNGLPSGCNLLVDPFAPNYLGILPLAVGSTVSWPLPLPETLGPMTLFFQDLILESANGDWSASERLEVPLVK